MNKTSTPANIQFDGNILIVASWPDNFTDDIDLYVEDPSGGIVYFGQKSNKVMHLDRDDRGQVGDVSPENREIATVRSPVAGEYVVNVHAYHKWESVPAPVTVSIYDLKNKKSIVEELLILDSQGEEKTVCRFTLDKNGKVIEVNDFPKGIVSNLMGRGM